MVGAFCATCTVTGNRCFAYVLGAFYAAGSATD